MVRVILRSRKVLIYNDADQYYHDHGICYIQKGDYGRAMFPSELVERIEFKKPCRILREKALKDIKGKC